MSGLDTLRPEVRCALGDLHYIAQANHTGQQQVDTIRAELLRLAAMERAWKQWIKDGMRVEFMPPEPPK